jgi:hypothetical protein
MDANDVSLAFIERSSISGSPHSEPTQKPKLISSSEVRAAVIARRSFFDELGNVQRDLHRAPPDAGSPMARRYHELKRHVRFWHKTD